MARQRSWSGCAKRRPQRRLRPRRRGRRPRRRRPKERRRPKMTTAPTTSGFKRGERSGAVVLQRGPAGAGAATPLIRRCPANIRTRKDAILGALERVGGPRAFARAPASDPMGRIVALARGRAERQLCQSAVDCRAVRTVAESRARLGWGLCSFLCAWAQADQGLVSQACRGLARAQWERGSGRKRGRCADVG